MWSHRQKKNNGGNYALGHNLRAKPFYTAIGFISMYISGGIVASFLIHWGLYALLGRGEWAMYNEAIDQDEYRSLMNRFSAERYDARAWACVEKAAGMKYIVLTNYGKIDVFWFDGGADRQCGTDR